jgi:3-carboxy-cis,cis-muconate cycloisomerase
MAARATDPLGLIHAEALSFALARRLGRGEAQAQVRTLATRARATGEPLPDLVARTFPEAGPTDLTALGTAPAQARRFATAARTRAASIAARA